MGLKKTLSTLHPLFIDRLCFTITLLASNIWLGVCDLYINSFIMDVGAMEKTSFHTRLRAKSFHWSALDQFKVFVIIYRVKASSFFF